MKKTILNNKKKRFAALALLLLLILLIGMLRAVWSYLSLKEKKEFTKEETHILWAELGLDYLTLHIDRAYFNEDLYVVSEPFESNKEIIQYLKQFAGNEKIQQDDSISSLKIGLNGREYEGYAIYNLYLYDKARESECFAFEHNGKWYIMFHKSEVRHSSGQEYNLYEMFGFE